MQSFGQVSVEATRTGNNPPAGIERRRHDRHRVLQGAAIVFRGGNCSVACDILDVSESGALPMPADATSCPGVFVLDPRSGTPRNCEVVWRTGTKLGVRYV